MNNVGVRWLLAILCSWPLLSIAAEVGGAIERSYFGLHVHQLEQPQDWPTVRFGSIRLWDAKVAWKDLEPAYGKWNFERLDRFVDVAASNGVDVLLPLGLTPRWAALRPDQPSHYGPGNASEPYDTDLWRNYVRTVGQRYKGRVFHYEIWNEPNIPGFFSGDIDKLVDLTRIAREELKRIDASIRIVSPGMSSGSKGSVEYLDRYLAGGGAALVDVVGYHAYVQDRQPEALVPLVNSLREVMARRRISSHPLWNTESGWRIEIRDGTEEPKWVRVPGWKKLDQEMSMSYVARAFLVGRHVGFERFYWYAWDNTALGLVEPKARAPKAAALAFDTVIRWLVGRVLDQCSVSSDVWSCRLVENSKQVGMIVWSAAGVRSFRIPSGQSVRSIEYLDGRTHGQPLPAVGDVLPVSESPLRIGF